MGETRVSQSTPLDRLRKAYAAILEEERARQPEYEKRLLEKLEAIK